MHFFQIITIIKIITFVHYVSNSAKIYLSKPQWNIIQHLLDNPQLTLPMRDKINTVLFHYYDDWSCYKAAEFKKFHQHKCNHIPLDELQMYSRIGLMKAIRNYKGKSLFSNYANIYIQGELYRGMTELHPLTIDSPRDRTNRTLSSTKKKYMLATYFVGSNEWVLDKLYHSKNNNINDVLHKHNIQDEFWNTIDMQPNIKTQRMIHYKFDYEWNPIRTNKQVAELMACSEEDVRKTIKNLSLHVT